MDDVVTFSSDDPAAKAAEVARQAEARHRVVTKYEEQQQALAEQRARRHVSIALITPTFLDDQ